MKKEKLIEILLEYQEGTKRHCIKIGKLIKKVRKSPEKDIPMGLEIEAMKPIPIDDIFNNPYLSKLGDEIFMVD